jgi:hypothetical protein
MPNVIILYAVVLIVITLNAFMSYDVKLYVIIQSQSTECHYAEYHHSVCYHADCL